MRFIALGDTHLGFRFGRNAVAKRKMTDYAAQQFKQVIDQAIAENVDVVFHTGDIFDRSQPPDWARQQYYQTVEHLLRQDITFMVIPGNHDRAVLQPSLMDYSYDNYVVFNKLKAYDYNGVRIIGLPYVYENHQERLKQVKNMVEQWAGPSIILAHQLFDGAWFGPQQFYFRQREDVYNVRQLPDRNQVLSGHIHRAQTVQGGKVVYTGSTTRTSFAEIIEPKGYLLGELDMTDNHIKIEFNSIESLPMVVIERDRKQLDIEELDTLLALQSRPARILLRLLNHKVDYTLLNQLYQRYSVEDYPYLSISPKMPNTILQPLYSVISTQFQPVVVDREWKALTQTIKY